MLKLTFLHSFIVHVKKEYFNVLVLQEYIVINIPCISSVIEMGFRGD